MSNTELVRQESGLLMPIATPKEMLQVHEAMVEFINGALTVDRDYGIIPGTSRMVDGKETAKLTLLKPGAELLCTGFGLIAHYTIMKEEVDHYAEISYSVTKWVTRDKPSNHEDLKAKGLGRNRKFREGNSEKWVWQEPETEAGISRGLYRYVILCNLFRGGVDVGQGIGACSSTEAKYIRTPHDVENTVLKMAKKRAHIDAVLNTLSLSDRFTQDTEDIAANKAAREPEYEDQSTGNGHHTPQPVPKSASDLEKERNAGLAFKRSFQGTKEQFAEFKAEAGAEWIDVILEAEQKEVPRSFEGLMLFVKGELTTDAEFVEEPNSHGENGTHEAQPDPKAEGAVPVQPPTNAGRMDASQAPTAPSTDPNKELIASFELSASQVTKLQKACQANDHAITDVLTHAKGLGTKKFDDLIGFADDKFADYKPKQEALL